MLIWLWAILAVVVGLLFLFMLEIPSLRALRLARKIPGLTGLPLIGNVFTLLRIKPEDGLDYLKMLSGLNPKLVRFESSGIITILVSEPDIIQAIMGSVNHIQKGREYLTVYPWLKDGLLLSTGNKWHMRRKLLTPAFHFRILEDSVSNINKNTNLLAHLLHKTRGQPVEVENFITKSTLDVIGESAMGVKIQAQTGVGEDYLQSIRRACRIMIQRVLNFYEYRDSIFYVTTNGRNFTKYLKTLHDFTIKVVKERKREFMKQSKEPEEKEPDSSGDQGKVRKAFLDSLLEMQKASPDSLTDQDIYEEVDTFMFEGHDTVSAAITFTLYLLGTYQTEQDKVYSELREIFGDSEREITMTDTHKMIYLEKVIKETLRIYPSVPYLSRQLTHDCVLEDGLVIPSTANVVMVPYLLHRDERYFPDPERFDPDRFSEDECQRRHPYAYLPFSAGPRNCIGQKFAMLEMKMTLGNILRKVRVEAVTKRTDFKVLINVIIRTTEPIVCKFYPRKPLYY